ncbi:hypothetical protein GGI15_004578 [Coemansia interrupta]|uniref:Uncharacterized protein n=1 Tax=Coemansia interrupta TaxID=1126814 RepID=A0A9W8H967_9FUNG|nr:hypothetical protein GGI15_004578 [Coemansia interrupta]
MNTSSMAFSVPLSPLGFASTVSGGPGAQGPASQTASSSLSISLTRSQYAIESGGVLIDPTTNEVCLLFYPDSSEWRLPMGRPDAMAAEHSTAGKDAAYVAAEPTVAGCEPPAHAAQRQISQITGYRCSHLHPAVAAQAQENPCAYMGPLMVEPLALQIEQRVTPAPATAAAATGGLIKPQADAAAAQAAAEDKPSADLFSPLADFHDAHGQRITLPQLSSAAEDDEDDDEVLADDNTPLSAVMADSESVYHHRLSTCQYVMTYYYMAWLTQSRFEQRAATQPVGPAATAGSEAPAMSSVLGPSSAEATRAQPNMPLAEVTWFKMDTAAQVLSHETDKMALREAIHRLSRYGAPRAPFAYSAAVLAEEAARHGEGRPAAPHVHSKKGASTAAAAAASAPAAGNAAPAATASDSGVGSSDAASSAASSSEASSDGATKAETAVAIPAARNMDIIRKTATSLGKRGGMLVKAARQGRASTSAATPAAADAAARTSTASDPGAKKPAMPRVLSIFYKFMGSAN